MIMSKLKEVIICLRAGRVTLPYPFEPSVVPEGFRGTPQVDVEKCIGCAGCANVCPVRLIQVYDDDETRRLIWHLERCTYCGRCAEVCPEQAVTMSKEFETSTNARADLHIVVDLDMGPCRRCGRCFPPPNPLDRMMVTGFREAPPLEWL